MINTAVLKCQSNIPALQFGEWVMNLGRFLNLFKSIIVLKLGIPEKKMA